MMEQQIRFCTTSDGVRIAYAVAGQGPPLVMVLGWVSHLEWQWEDPFFRSWFEPYAQRFLFVRYDKRGTGLSDRGVRDFSVEARLRDLEAVIDHVKLPRFALWGASEGGAVAIAFAARNPRRVSRLVLYGTHASGLARGREEATKAVVDLVRAEWGLGSRTMATIFNPQATTDDVQRFMKLQQVGATREDAADMAQANLEVDVSDLLPLIECPTLVVHATGDLAVPFELGREIASGIPDARFVPIESERHFVADEAQAQAQEAILDFLQEEDQVAAAQPAHGGFATILFTDMEGSTTLADRLGDAGAQEVRHAHNEIVRAALAENGGNEIKHTGDGIMASFATASSALECAIVIQRGVAAHKEEHPDSPLGVYVGLNAGEPIAEGDPEGRIDLFGTSVDLAARLVDHAQPGQIIVSDVVRQLAAGKDFLFSDLGETELRGFEDPVKLWELRWEEHA